ncbi:uncharacterized protein ColSpa_06244 [Colletotrichum spaethianum]|uniref:RanBP2-type domain-containing protein n=1 Tax=Colletotrichum spaethianum TaxID=700344 RepID=A0AA37LCU7_9PEZI|nr:uncharacterized protein ColSpa_06244 [Colletotrichum spaethianum]GKT46063.1 hypothetical protein ColSpa_06244 [Colletotrichum spaethianum]
MPTPRTRTKVVWYCHNCSSGPFNYKIDEHCPVCQMRRCRYCTVQEIQTAIRSLADPGRRGSWASIQPALRTGEAATEHRM